MSTATGTLARGAPRPVGDPGRAGAAGGALRLASRLARREVRRRPGRTALVAILVALPVAAMTMAAVLLRTDVRSEAQEWRGQYGLAEAMLYEPQPAELPLPPGSRTVSYREEYDRLIKTVGGDRVLARVSDLPLEDPIAAPILTFSTGRAPRASGEVALTAAAARSLHARVGFTVELQRPFRGTWTVVGVGVLADSWGATAVFVAPGSDVPWSAPNGTMQRIGLVDLPDGSSTAELDVLRRDERVSLAPWLRQTDFDMLEAGRDSEVAWSYVIGALALLIMGIVISAAFASGARRQLTTLGQLGANGARPAMLRRTLALQGAWTGVVGVALGFSIAAAGLWVLHGHLPRLLDRQIGGYRISVTDVAVIAVLGLAAATGAALIPARSASTVPVLAALAGRRPVADVRRSVTAGGGLALVGGLGVMGLAVLGSNSGDSNSVWALAAIVGGAMVLLGTCAVAPAWTGVLGAPARRFGGTLRIAARGLVRQRSRTAAVVAGVCAITTLAVAASSLVAIEVQGSADDPRLRADEIHLRGLRVVTTMVDDSTGATSEKVESAPIPAALSAAVRTAMGTVTEIPLSMATGADPASDYLWVTQVGSGGEADHETDHRMFSWSQPWPVIADQAFLDAYPQPAPVTAALRSGGAAIMVAPGDQIVVSTVSVRLARSAAPGQDPLDAAPAAGESVAGPFAVAVVDGNRDLSPWSGLMLITPQRATQLGLRTVPAITVMRSERPVNSRQKAAITDLMLDYADEERALGYPQPRVMAEMPSDPATATTINDILAAAALILALLVIGASLALSAAETREERELLSVVGASPAAGRRASAWKAWMLATLGALMGVPVALVMVWVFVSANEYVSGFVVPWRTIAAMIVAVPLAAAAATWLGSLIGQIARPLRISTLSSE